MEFERSVAAERRREQGLSLMEVVIGFVVLTGVALAVLGAIAGSARMTTSPNPKAVAQTDLSNVQTDLNAVIMYDASTLSSLHNGAKITLSPSPAPSGTTYGPIDTGASTIVLQNITATSTTANISVKFAVPGLSGSSTISLYQRAPGSCSTALHDNAVHPC